MSTQKLIYDVIIFFFDDAVHFAELLILIFLIRGDLSKAADKLIRFIRDVKIRYKEKITERNSKKGAIDGRFNY